MSRLERARHGAIGRRIGPRHPGRRHRAGAQLAMTLSHTSALAAGFARSSLSSASPAVRSLWLWQVTQYVSRNWRGLDVVCEPRGCTAKAAPNRVAKIGRTARERCFRDRVARLLKLILPHRWEFPTVHSSIQQRFLVGTGARVLRGTSASA